MSSWRIEDISILISGPIFENNIQGATYRWWTRKHNWSRETSGQKRLYGLHPTPGGQRTSLSFPTCPKGRCCEWFRCRLVYQSFSQNKSFPNSRYSIMTIKLLNP